MVPLLAQDGSKSSIDCERLHTCDCLTRSEVRSQKGRDTFLFSRFFEDFWFLQTGQVRVDNFSLLCKQEEARSSVLSYIFLFSAFFCRPVVAVSLTYPVSQGKKYRSCGQKSDSPSFPPLKWPLALLDVCVCCGSRSPKSQARSKRRNKTQAN